MRTSNPPRRRHRAAAALLLLATLGGAHAGENHRHVVKPGETLIGIGQAILQEPNDWVKVGRLNRVAEPRRLQPGSALRIPVDLLKREPAPGRVAALTGKVSADGTPLAVGDSIARGAQLATGERSFATIELVDGSRLVLQPGSRVKVEELARYRNTETLQTRLRLDGGRIESAVAKTSAPRPRYTIVTPTATIGVRGTSFRVGAEEAGPGQTEVEVTEGTVGAQGGQASGKGKPVAVPAGYGLIAAADGQLSKPVALLPPPALDALPKLQERTIVRFAVPALAGAARYRFQVGRDPAMRDVIADSLSDRPEAKFADLPDGDYLLRVRGVDSRGLEGRDADFAFTLKARPEPPFATAPVGGAKLRAESAQLAWAANADAARYRVQLAADARFAEPLADIDGVEGTTIMPAQKLAPRDYWWRARSIRADGDAGPWGDPQRFVLKPLPAEPGPPDIGDDRLTFAWSGEPGQTFRFQFARDARFADLVAEQRLDQPATTLPRPPAGAYYMRVQATDPDGFVGPYTSPQKIEVPQPPPPWWLPLLVLLPAVL